jgi:8-oxo-dGTP pyrophosphatase MutT (NUDIX family)
MSPYRPDLVDCWIFRVPSTGPEILLIRRAPGRILPGLWQCVSGGLEAGERVALGALREVHEETGFDASTIEAFYDLDQVNQFHEPSVDAVLSSVIFAVRVRADAEPTLSNEHDGARWVPLGAAYEEAVWPGYRESIARIRDHLLDRSRASWFELTLEGGRVGD